MAWWRPTGYRTELPRCPPERIALPFARFPPNRFRPVAGANEPRNLAQLRGSTPGGNFEGEKRDQ